MELYLFEKTRAYSSGPRNVIAIWGPTGTGKTRAAYEAGATMVEWTGCFLQGYGGESMVVFDDFDWKQMPRSTFLRMTDRYPYTFNIKGGQVSWAATTIYITSNYDPKTWYMENGLEDGAVQRRFTEVIYKD